MLHPKDVLINDFDMFTNAPETMTPIEMLLFSDATTQQITDLVTSATTTLSSSVAGPIDYQQGLKILNLPVPGIAYFLISLLVTVLLAITLGLLGHLLGFHIFLSKLKKK